MDLIVPGLSEEATAVGEGSSKHQNEANDPKPVLCPMKVLGHSLVETHTALHALFREES